MANINRNYFLIALTFIILGAAVGYFISMELKHLTSEPSNIQDELNVHIQRINDEIYYAEQDQADFSALQARLESITSDSSLLEKLLLLSIDEDTIDRMRALPQEEFNETISQMANAMVDVCYGAMNRNALDCYRSSAYRDSDTYPAYDRYYSIVEPYNRKVCSAIDELYARVDFKARDYSREYQLNQLYFQYNKENLREIVNGFYAKMGNLVHEVKLKIETNETVVTANKERIAELKKSLKDLSEKGVSRLLILYAVPIFGLLLLILMIIPSFYNSPDIKKTIFDSGLLLQLVTVFLLTAIILLLGIGNKLESEVLGTLLGGISVYVLQQSATALNRNKKQDASADAGDHRP